MYCSKEKNTLEGRFVFGPSLTTFVPARSSSSNNVETLPIQGLLMFRVTVDGPSTEAAGNSKILFTPQETIYAVC